MPKSVDLAKKILISHKVKHFVDLNTDLGQSRDQAFFTKTNYELLNTVSSVNIPCAVHDGDPKELLEAMRQAKRYNWVSGRISAIRIRRVTATSRCNFPRMT